MLTSALFGVSWMGTKGTTAGVFFSSCSYFNALLRKQALTRTLWRNSSSNLELQDSAVVPMPCKAGEL